MTQLPGVKHARTGDPDTTISDARGTTLIYNPENPHSYMIVSE